MRQSFIIKYFNNKKIKLLSYERDNFQHCCTNIVACWCVRVVVVFKRIQQLPTTPKNMQQGLQTDAACNIQQCCVRLQGGLNLPEISRYSIKYLFLPIFVSVLLFTKQTSRGTDVSKYFSFIHPPPFSIKVLSAEDKRSGENTQKRVCCDKG